MELEKALIGWQNKTSQVGGQGPYNHTLLSNKQLPKWDQAASLQTKHHRETVHICSLVNYTHLHQHGSDLLSFSEYTPLRVYIITNFKIYKF